MTQQELESKIMKALDTHRIAAFATIEGNRPKARYMAVFHDGLKIYLASDRQTHKVEELKENPNVYLLLGYDGNWPKEVVEIQGLAEVTKNDSLREKFWSEKFKRWFDGPNDPNYVILEISPSRIEYTGEDRERQVWSS